MPEDIAGAVDAGAFSVPHGKDAIELAFAAQLRLLRAPDGGRGHVLVQPELEADVGFFQPLFRAQELLVEGTERRAAIAADIARSVEARAAVALLLHQTEPNQRLEAGDKDRAFGQVVFVVERDVAQRHFWGLRRQSAPAAGRPPEGKSRPVTYIRACRSAMLSG